MLTYRVFKNGDAPSLGTSPFQQPPPCTQARCPRPVHPCHLPAHHVLARVVLVDVRVLQSLTTVTVVEGGSAQEGTMSKLRLICNPCHANLLANTVSQGGRQRGLAVHAGSWLS
jgi:hypothetical protein